MTSAYRSLRDTELLPLLPLVSNCRDGGLGEVAPGLAVASCKLTPFLRWLPGHSPDVWTWDKFLKALGGMAKQLAIALPVQPLGQYPERLFAVSGGILNQQGSFRYQQRDLWGSSLPYAGHILLWATAVLVTVVEGVVRGQVTRPIKEVVGSRTGFDIGAGVRCGGCTCC